MTFPEMFCHFDYLILVLFGRGVTVHSCFSSQFIVGFLFFFCFCLSVALTSLAKALRSAAKISDVQFSLALSAVIDHPRIQKQLVMLKLSQAITRPDCTLYSRLPAFMASSFNTRQVALWMPLPAGVSKGRCCFKVSGSSGRVTGARSRTPSGDGNDASFIPFFKEK